MKILAALFFIQAFVCTLSFAEDSSVDAVIKSAQIKKLHEARQWLKLLHIERNWVGIKGTQVTNEQFFFSKDKADAKEELIQTLKAFQTPAATHAKVIEDTKKQMITDHSEHPICRFPARLKYLQVQLSEHADYWSSLPQLNCAFQKIYLNALDAKSVSFVFSSYFSDSPGSAFGHTFFRVNRKSNTERQELLDFGIGYAAQVSVSNPVLYALLGLVGGFSGVWTNLPYYYKVREYNDFESRDLWSYDLNLSAEEVEMLALHLWEVGSSSYTYYFFTQNCAFHMLTLLEAAAPRLNLIEHVPFYYVIPADSMKTLFYEKDLVASVTYRPSLRRVFLERIKNLDEQSIKDIHEFAKTYELNKVKGTRSDQQFSAYLDAAVDLISLRFPDLKEKSNAKMFAIKEELLNVRAEINHVSPPIVLEPKDTERPDYSHGSSRFSMNYLKKNDEFGLTYRFAIHDLLDNSVGMPENSQLEFFNLSFKKYDRKIVLDNFNLFKVLNLNPFNFFEKKLSWGMKLGSTRLDINPGIVKPFYSTGIETQVGYSFALTKQERPFTLWTMGKFDLGYAGKEKNGKYGYGAVGYNVGLLKRFNNEHAFLLTYEKLFPYKLDSYEKTEFEFRSSLSRDLSVGVGLSKKTFKAEAYFYF